MVRPGSRQLRGVDSSASEEGYVFARLMVSTQIARFLFPCPLIAGIFFSPLCVLIVWVRQSFRGAFARGPGLEAIWHLLELGTAAGTKSRTLGGVCSRHLFPHSCGGWKSEIKVLAGSVSPEASLLGSQVAVSSPRVLTGSSLCLPMSHPSSDQS